MSFSAQEVLITEHLTFAPLSLVDDIINTANALLYKSVNAMEQLFSNLPADVMPDEEVESGIHKFETLLESSVDRNFDALELFILRNITNIPDDLLAWVQLRHHEGLDFTTDESIEAEEDLLKARKTLAASQKVSAMIAREQQIMQRRLTALEAHSEKLRFLEEKARENQVSPLQETSDYIREQIESLRSLLSQTTDLASVLKVEPKATERSQYIEKVLLHTVSQGTWDSELSATSTIGTVEDMQKAIAVLKQK